jgi:porin
MRCLSFASQYRLRLLLVAFGLLLATPCFGQNPAVAVPAIGTIPVTDPTPLPGADAVDRLTGTVCPCPTPDAAPTPPAPPPFGGPLLERPKLTGDWYGVRDTLRDHGITFDISSTNFYQGVTSGGVQDAFKFGGRADIYMNIDGQKAGLWQGLFVTLHDETIYGQSVNSFTGAVSPISLSQAFPIPNGSTNALTGVKITQALSESFVVFSGKINTLDELNQPFTGGRGVDSFMNSALVFNPIYARTVPYSTLGAGAAYLKDLQPIVSVMVMDTANTPTTSGFENFIQNGVTVLGQLNLPIKPFDLPGHQGLSFTYSTGTYTDLSPTAYILIQNILQGLPALSRVRNSWSMAYSFDQALWVDESNPKRSWGLFGNAGLSDGNPNPIKWDANIGVGGSSPFSCRKLDTFGVGYFYLGLSDAVKDFAPRAFPIRDEQGVELFYNYAVTPWFHFTPDLQVVIPARERIDPSVNFGLRAKIDF